MLEGLADDSGVRPEPSMRSAAGADWAKVRDGKAVTEAQQLTREEKIMMNETLEHTPGPWKVGYGGNDGDDYAVITSPHSERAICNLEPRDYKPSNARLIAAAPELLRALEGLIGRCISEGVGTSWANLEDARSVLSRARSKERE